MFLYLIESNYIFISEGVDNPQCKSHSALCTEDFGSREDSERLGKKYTPFHTGCRASHLLIPLPPVFFFLLCAQSCLGRGLEWLGECGGLFVFQDE